MRYVREAYASTLVYTRPSYRNLDKTASPKRAPHLPAIPRTTTFQSQSTANKPHRKPTGGRTFDAHAFTPVQRPDGISKPNSAQNG
jgi:hypothetical protein